MPESCSLNCAVNAPGMCCTMITAAGHSRGKNGASFIRVAGPPVEAAITTSGNLLFDGVGLATLFDFARSDTAPGLPPGSVRGFEAAFAWATFVRDAVRTTRTFAAIFNLRT